MNLKKQFQTRDVQRMRNLITGKTGDKTQTQAGWEKHQVDHKEGDVWEQDGKDWTIKDGIKQTVTKLDSIKRLVVLPFNCPKCNGLMKVNDLNKKMWAIHGTCFSCVVEMETELKRQGKWEEYESDQMNANKNATLDDLDSALEAWMTDKLTYVSEAGDVEEWSSGGDKKESYKEIKEFIAKLRNKDIYNQTE